MKPINQAWEATARPWTFKRISPEDVEIYDSNGNTVSTMNHDILDTDWCNNRAALIVRAVNLLEVLEEVAEAAKFAQKWNLMHIEKVNSPMPLQLEKALCVSLSKLSELKKSLNL